MDKKGSKPVCIDDWKRRVCPLDHVVSGRKKLVGETVCIILHRVDAIIDGITIDRSIHQVDLVAKIHSCEQRSDSIGLGGETLAVEHPQNIGAKSINRALTRLPVMAQKVGKFVGDGESLLRLVVAAVHEHDAGPKARH